MSNDQMKDMEEEEEENDQMSKPKKGRKKNLTIICIIFVCVFTSTNAVNNLQSSVNIDGDIGLLSLAFLTAGSMFASLLLSTPFIYLLGYKWNIIGGQIAMLAYVAVNMHPIPPLIYPICLLGGMLRVSMWTAQSAYLTLLATDTKEKNEDQIDDSKLNKYFGIFFCTYQTAQIWGNLVTYLILRDPTEVFSNDTSKCGAQFLQSEHQSDTNGSVVSVTTAYILYGVFVFIILISIVLLLIFLDQFRQSKNSDEKDLFKRSLKFTLSTLKQLKNPNHIILAPLAFWTTASETFIFGTFTNSFITCTLSIQYIGLVMTVYGITASIFSIIMGYIAKLNHSHTICMLISSGLSYGIFIVMLLWNPNAHQAYVLYILASISGLTTAIIKPFTTALYGSIFVDRKETAFSIFSFIQNGGGLVVFLTSSILRVRTSIILQIVYLSLATISFLIIQYRQRHTPKIISTLTVLPSLVFNVQRMPINEKY